jgi:plastocyanin
VVAKSLTFRSRALDTEDGFSQQFNEVGEIDYFCSLHPHMAGKVIVRGRGK